MQVAAFTSLSITSLTISIATLASVTASCTVLHALMPSQFVPTIHGHRSAMCTFGTR